MLSPLASVWIEFALALAVIGVSGTALSRYGDVIAQKTGLGGTWIGVVLLATVTSLPEMVTGVSAAALAKAPDIVVGGVLGSCVFNLSIIVVLDFLHREESIYRRASQGHILSAGFGVMLIGFTGFNLLLSRRGLLPSFGWVGSEAPLLVLLYLLSMRTLYRYEASLRAQAAAGSAAEKPEPFAHITLRRAVALYAASGAGVVAAGLYLPFTATRMAQLMGWGESFVGSLLVALATSVPEVVVTLACLRIGALDMAIANVLGSNLFNIAVLPVSDLFYTEGPLLAHASPIHVVTAVSAMTMSGVAIVGLLYRPERRVFKTVGWVSLFLLFFFLFNNYVLYLRSE